MVMFDYISAMKVINRSLIDVVDALNPLTPVEYEVEAAPYRMVEKPQVLAVEQQQRVTSIITAHNIAQYSNKFHSVALKEDVECWLDWLLDASYIDEILSLQQ